MADQIQSVTQNIEKLNLSTSDWEREQLKSLQQCEDAKEIALKSFSRFTSISVPTQMWLSSEGHATKSMTAIADLQGLVGEWSALRSIAAEIQVLYCTALYCHHTLFSSVRDFSYSVPILLHILHTLPYSFSGVICVTCVTVGDK